MPLRYETCIMAHGIQRPCPNSMKISLGSPMAKLNGILETCLYVDDLVAAELFYRKVLDCEFVGRRENRHVFFRVGAQMLLLFHPSQSRLAELDVPPHGADGSSHVAFAIEPAELPGWRERLALHDVPIEKEVTWPGGEVSMYFRDPAGNSLELACPTIWDSSD